MTGFASQPIAAMPSAASASRNSPRPHPRSATGRVHRGNGRRRSPAGARISPRFPGSALRSRRRDPRAEGRRPGPRRGGPLPRARRDSRGRAREVTADCFEGKTTRAGGRAGPPPRSDLLRQYDLLGLLPFLPPRQRLDAPSRSFSSASSRRWLARRSWPAVSRAYALAGEARGEPGKVGDGPVEARRRLPGEVLGALRAFSRGRRKSANPRLRLEKRPAQRLEERGVERRLVARDDPEDAQESGLERPQGSAGRQDGRDEAPCVLQHGSRPRVRGAAGRGAGTGPRGRSRARAPSRKRPRATQSAPQARRPGPRRRVSPRPRAFRSCLAYIKRE